MARKASIGTITLSNTKIFTLVLFLCYLSLMLWYVYGFNSNTVGSVLWLALVRKETCILKISRH